MSRAVWLEAASDAARIAEEIRKRGDINDPDEIRAAREDRAAVADRVASHFRLKADLAT